MHCGSRRPAPSRTTGSRALSTRCCSPRRQGGSRAAGRARPAELHNEIANTFGTRRTPKSAADKHMERVAWVRSNTDSLDRTRRGGRQAGGAWEVRGRIVTDIDRALPACHEVRPASDDAARARWPGVSSQADHPRRCIRIRCVPPSAAVTAALPKVRLEALKSGRRRTIAFRYLTDGSSRVQWRRCDRRNPPRVEARCAFGIASSGRRRPEPAGACDRCSGASRASSRSAVVGESRLGHAGDARRQGGSHGCHPWWVAAKMGT